MIISPQLGFVFLAIPRTASVSMSQALLTLPGSFSVKGDRHRMRIPEAHKGLFIFCCVRNPYSRICSHWAKVRQQNRYAGTFREFIERFVDEGQRSEKPMTAWLGGNRLDQVLRFEHLAEDWQTLPFVGEVVLPVLNVSGIAWKNQYTEELAKKVYTWCHNDFERFNYEKESWR